MSDAVSHRLAGYTDQQSRVKYGHTPILRSRRDSVAYAAEASAAPWRPSRETPPSHWHTPILRSRRDSVAYAAEASAVP